MLPGRPLTAPGDAPEPRAAGDTLGGVASGAPPEARPTVRAIVLDACDRVLLQAYLDADVHRPGGRPHASPAWIAPGGGLAPGEDPAAGLAREWHEETGLDDVSWGPWLWCRRVDLVYQGRLRRFDELYRLGRIARELPPVRPAALERHELVALLGHRWWPVAELAIDGGVVYPPRLAARLRDVLLGHLPGSPLDISGDG